MSACGGPGDGGLPLLSLSPCGGSAYVPVSLYLSVSLHLSVTLCFCLSISPYLLFLSVSPSPPPSLSVSLASLSAADLIPLSRVARDTVSLIDLLLPSLFSLLTADGELQVLFTCVDPSDPARSFSFTVQVTNSGKYNGRAKPRRLCRAFRGLLRFASQPLTQMELPLTAVMFTAPLWSGPCSRALPTRGAAVLGASGAAECDGGLLPIRQGLQGGVQGALLRGREALMPLPMMAMMLLRTTDIPRSSEEEDLQQRGRCHAKGIDATTELRRGLRMHGGSILTIFMRIHPF